MSRGIPTFSASLRSAATLAELPTRCTTGLPAPSILDSCYSPLSKAPRQLCIIKTLLSILSMQLHHHRGSLALDRSSTVSKTAQMARERRAWTPRGHASSPSPKVHRPVRNKTLSKSTRHRFSPTLSFPRILRFPPSGPDPSAPTSTSTVLPPYLWPSWSTSRTLAPSA